MCAGSLPQDLFHRKQDHCKTEQELPKQQQGCKVRAEIILTFCVYQRFKTNLEKIASCLLLLLLILQWVPLNGITDNGFNQLKEQIYPDLQDPNYSVIPNVS
jgi:hypothetical protein